MSRGAEVRGAAMDLLVEAGAVLATSLELPPTMGQIARLTVPELADLCVIDLVDDDGSIRTAAVASQDEHFAPFAPRQTVHAIARRPEQALHVTFVPSLGSTTLPVPRQVTQLMPPVPPHALQE